MSNTDGTLPGKSNYDFVFSMAYYNDGYITAVSNQVEIISAWEVYFCKSI